RQLTARRWQVMAWCGAGGAVAAVMLIGMMLLSELSSFATAGDLARAALPVIGEYTLFGLVGGFVIVLIPIAWTDPLLLGARIIVVIAVIVVAIDAAAYSLSEKRAKGLVF